ncbi:MAG: hypothetical protein WC225_02790 [Acholeplasmataceae bacterium]
MSVFEYRNPHPKGLHTTDCVVRAVALAFDKDYLEARRELNRSKKELGFGSYKETKFIYKYLEDFDRIVLKVPKGVPRVKVDDFAKFFKEGTHIVKLAKHIVCIKGGKLLDTWDSSYRSVYTAWKIK